MRFQKTVVETVLKNDNFEELRRKKFAKHKFCPVKTGKMGNWIQEVEPLIGCLVRTSEI